jgi:Ca2+-binding EF-hand superfamily protein
MDGSGSISVEELQSVLSSLGFSADEQHIELVKKVDSNNSGEIDWPEFKQFLLLLKKRNIATQIEASARAVFS